MWLCYALPVLMMMLHLPACAGFSAIADVIFQTAPTNAAATQNAVQNMVAGTPEAVKELPEKFIIAASLTAVALLGYLLRDKFRKGT